MKIKNQGTVVVGRKDTDMQSCAFPHICILPSGRWLCSFRAAPEKAATTGQHPMLTWSDDEGKCWSNPIAPFVPPDVDGKPGLFRSLSPTAMDGQEMLGVLFWVDHSDPSLPFFNEQTEGLLDTRIFLVKSVDNGETWSQSQLVDTSPFNVPVATTGPILRLPNGDLACQFELNKHYYDTSVWRHSSVFKFSMDGGKTWPCHAISSNDPENRIFYWDQRPSVLPDGQVLDLFWTYDNQDGVYLNIHGRESLDKGRTWSEMWNAGIPGQPAPPVALPDGTIGMVYVDRTAIPVIKMRTSKDNGRTWPGETEIIIYETAGVSQTQKKASMQDAWAEMGKFSVGLPATSVMANGDIVVVYYAGPHTDQTNIEWVRLQSK